MVKESAQNAIASGAITVEQSYNVVEAESGTTDDLDDINLFASDLDGPALVLLKADAGDTITVKHATGNITTTTGADVTLTGDTILQFLVSQAEAVQL